MMATKQRQMFSMVCLKGFVPNTLILLFTSQTVMRDVEKRSVQNVVFDKKRWCWKEKFEVPWKCQMCIVSVILAQVGMQYC